jgi:hypothetical protein
VVTEQDQKQQLKIESALHEWRQAQDEVAVAKHRSEVKRLEWIDIKRSCTHCYHNGNTSVVPGFEYSSCDLCGELF